jgi:hypothetical protein
VANTVCVLATINLNGQPFLHAHEIDYVAPYGVLSADSELADLPHPHMTP